jgi:hypothetical protein
VVSEVNAVSCCVHGRRLIGKDFFVMARSDRG